MRRGFKIALWIVGALVLVFGGLLAWSGGKLVSIEFEDFPQDKLEELLAGEGTQPGGLSFTGPGEVEAHSRWTQWAMKLFPGTFMVDVKVNNRRATLVVDSGAEMTVISPAVAAGARISLSKKLSRKLSHWGQEYRLYMGWAKEVEVAGLAAHDLPIAVMSREPVLKVLGVPVYHLGGFLGMSFMERLAVTVDWRSGTTALRRQPAELDLPSAPLRLIEKEEEGARLLIPVIEGFLDDVGPHEVLVDTGTSSKNLLIPEELWKELGWEGDQDDIAAISALSS